MNKKSATLIDNIFMSCQDYKCISGNVTTYISDYLPQFIIIPNIFGNTFTKKMIKLCVENLRSSILILLRGILMHLMIF